MTCHTSLLWPKVSQTSFLFSSLLSRLFRLAQAVKKTVTSLSLLALTMTMTTALISAVGLAAAETTTMTTTLFALFLDVKVYLYLVLRKKDCFLMTTMIHPALMALLCYVSFLCLWL